MNARLVKQSDVMQRAIETVIAHAPDYDFWYFAEWFEEKNGYKPSELQILEQLQWFIEEMEMQ